MYANLHGDFVRGKDFSHLPEKLQEGIRLHRMIDDYIDHHPVVLELDAKVVRTATKSCRDCCRSLL